MLHWRLGDVSIHSAVVRVPGVRPVAHCIVDGVVEDHLVLILDAAVVDCRCMSSCLQASANTASRCTHPLVTGYKLPTRVLELQLAHSLLRGDYSTSTYPALTNTLHVLSSPPTLPPVYWWVIGPQSCPVVPPTRTGLLSKRGILDVSASHQLAVYIR
jgi:hypothetical protein